MGAWIETVTLIVLAELSTVAPYVGAWIETSISFGVGIPGTVAPYVGAWIETGVYDPLPGSRGSRTLRGCVD